MTPILPDSQQAALDIGIGTLRMLIEGYKIPYPLVMERVQALYDPFAPGRENKGFSLNKVPDRKRGFVFYVRYYDKGAIVPSRWSAGTNDHSPAGAFARQNRERLLAAYYKKRQVGRLQALEDYYKENPPYLEIDRRRQRSMCEQNRRAAYNFITRIFIPFLKELSMVTVSLEDCHFIDVRISKTRNGLRRRPLHGFIHGKLAGYLTERGVKPDELIFPMINGRDFRKAYLAIGTRLGKSVGELEAGNISFYSGRHFWKTMMNAGGLGEDAEEYRMGHAVPGEAAKVYNHRDKQGREIMPAKTREAFAILDEYLFEASARENPYRYGGRKVVVKAGGWTGAALFPRRRLPDGQARPLFS
ncbi:MAG: site-specific recombinase, phage integrase family [Treponematales bacterium]